MQQFRLFRYRYFLLCALAAPVCLWADADGPDPGLAGVPGEAGNCTVCHGAGSSSINTGGGSVKITFPSGTTYVPGQVQKWIVTIADSSAKRWGFQAAARKASDTTVSAGGFVAADTNTQVLCSSSSLNRPQRTTSGVCATSAPLMYVEQTLTGSRSGTSGPLTYEFNWTPPATDIGPVAVYISANAANGNNAADTGDHIYTASYTLTAASASSSLPAVSSNGVVNGASFAQSIAAGSWVTIQGTNFTQAANCSAANPQTGCRTWTASDFTNGTPTSLDGVSVSIGGKAAFVYYVSPTQINVLAPDAGTGSMAVTVTNSSGTSSAVTATLDNFAPAFFLAGSYAIATHLDGTLVAPSAVFAGASPAKQGETVILWGTGFGPVTPTVPAGQTSSQALGSTVAYVTTAPAVTIGGVSATVTAAALNPSSLGLYQVVITVPDSAPSGDQAIVASAGGKASPASGVLFSIQ